MKLLIIIYGIFLLSFTFFTYLFVDKNLFYLGNFYTGFSVFNREIVTCAYVILVSLFFIFYYLFLKRISTGILSNLLIITPLFLFISYPAVLSYDIFNYIFTAKVLFWYGENPFIIMPIEFLGDPLLSFTHAANKVALYGPSWVVSTGIPHFLGFNNFVLTLFSFKLFVLIFYFGIIYLIYKFTKNINNVSYFALNPLVLIETMVSGHNDVVMIFFALLSFYLLKKDRFILAIVFLIFSILIKYATLFLIPIFIYYLFQRYKKKKVDWDKVFVFSAVLMFFAFILSPIREEIYPWYAIWFLTFISLTNVKQLKVFGFITSFGLLLRYVPFMYLGTHFGFTPIIKILVTYVPMLGFIIYYLKDVGKLKRTILK